MESTFVWDPFCVAANQLLVEFILSPSGKYILKVPIYIDAIPPLASS